MLTEKNYVSLSIELHLFFARIMKEHCIFLQASLRPINQDLINQARYIQQQYEEKMLEILPISKGHVSRETLETDELITDYTLGCEEKTILFTGIPINLDITREEARLNFTGSQPVTAAVYQQIRRINDEMMTLIDDTINLKQTIYNAQKDCTIFLDMFPLNVEHILEEAEYYRRALRNIFQGVNYYFSRVLQAELFWNMNMQQHALFTRGSLDPTEGTAIIQANNFSQIYAESQTKLLHSTTDNIDEIENDIAKDTLNFMEYNAGLTDKIASCKMKSMILPLSQDHQLRESNYYSRLLSLRA